MENNQVEIEMFDPDYVYIFCNHKNKLCYKDLKNNRIYEGISVSLLFPLTNRNTFIRLLDYSQEELGLIRDLADLDNESKKVLKGELERIYFIPRITKIYNIEDKFGISRWKVDTEKGQRSFDIENRRSIRFVKSFDKILDNKIETNEELFQLFITDIDGNRYEIPSKSHLDHQSQELLDASL